MIKNKCGKIRDHFINRLMGQYGFKDSGEARMIGRKLSVFAEKMGFKERIEISSENVQRAGIRGTPKRKLNEIIQSKQREGKILIAVFNSGQLTTVMDSRKSGIPSRPDTGLYLHLRFK